MSIELSAEEKAYIESGGSKPLPDDYAADLPAPIEETTSEPNAAVDGENPDPAASENKDEGQGTDGGDTAKGPVPYGALKEERERRQKAEQQSKELQDRISVISDRLTRVMEAQERRVTEERIAAQPQPELPQIPDEAEDPLGALAWVKQQLLDQSRQREQETRQQQEARQRQEHAVHFEQQVKSIATQSVNQYRQKDPSFDDALGYLKKQRFEQHILSGVPQDLAVELTHKDELAFYAQCLQARKDPAEHLVAFARASGWAPKTPEPAPTPAAVEQLETVARGQAANGSLSSGGTSGNARSSKVDSKALAEMDEDEWNVWYAKNGGIDGLKKVMGG